MPRCTPFPFSLAVPTKNKIRKKKHQELDVSYALSFRKSLGRFPVSHSDSDPEDAVEGKGACILGGFVAFLTVL